MQIVQSFIYHFDWKSWVDLDSNLIQKNYRT